VDPGVVERVGVGHCVAQRAQQDRDVLEGHGLQGSLGAQRVVVLAQSAFGGLAGVGQLVEHPPAVEVLDRRDGLESGKATRLPQAGDASESSADAIALSATGSPPSSSSAARTSSGRRWTVNRSLARTKACMTRRYRTQFGAVA